MRLRQRQALEFMIEKENQKVQIQRHISYYLPPEYLELGTFDLPNSWRYPTTDWAYRSFQRCMVEHFIDVNMAEGDSQRLDKVNAQNECMDWQLNNIITIPFLVYGEMTLDIAKEYLTQTQRYQVISAKDHPLLLKSCRYIRYVLTQQEHLLVAIIR